MEQIDLEYITNLCSDYNVSEESVRIFMSIIDLNKIKEEVIYKYILENCVSSLCSFATIIQIKKDINIPSYFDVYINTVNKIYPGRIIDLPSYTSNAYNKIDLHENELELKSNKSLIKKVIHAKQK